MSRLASSSAPGRLLAVSDLHVAFPENRKFIEELWPESAGDWLLVAGDVGEKSADIEWALSELSRRFDTVIWTPGNHELWTLPSDPVQLRGAERYREVVHAASRPQWARAVPVVRTGAVQVNSLALALNRR